MGGKVVGGVYEALQKRGIKLMWTREHEVGTRRGWIGMERMLILFGGSALRYLTQMTLSIHCYYYKVISLWVVSLTNQS
jgi:hypothetical protein